MCRTLPLLVPFTLLTPGSILAQVSLEMTFTDSYDPGAVARGARTNNDGQLVFGVLSAF